MSDIHALTPAITLMLVGILAISVKRRIGLSPIVGYLTAGIHIGHHALGLIKENETTHLLLGVARQIISPPTEKGRDSPR